MRTITIKKGMEQNPELRRALKKAGDEFSRLHSFDKPPRPPRENQEAPDSDDLNDQPKECPQ